MGLNSPKNENTNVIEKINRLKLKRLNTMFKF